MSINKSGLFDEEFKMLSEDDVISPEPNLKLQDPSKYIQDPWPESPIHYNLRTNSYSSFGTLHSCARRFELSRLMPRTVDVDDDEDEAGHLDFGTVVGNGIQELLVHGDMQRAYFRAFLDWNDNLESERGEKSAKTFWHALQAISRFKELLYGPLSQYELARFHGRPAVELGFTIDCGGGFRYRGKLDALLIHRITREFLPLECKTTGSYKLHEAMYQNSSQAVGYALVIDRVALEMGLEYAGYDVFYPVYQTRIAEWHPFRFHKDKTSRASWLQGTLVDINSIQQYHDIGYFPMRGESCFHYNKPCRFFGTCTLSNELLLGDVDALPKKLDKIEDYPLSFSLSELVEAQVEKE